MDVCFIKPVLTLWSTPSRTSRSRPCRSSWSCPVSFWPVSSWWPSGACVVVESHGKHSEVDHQSPPTVKYTMSTLDPTYRYIVSIVKFCKALFQAWRNKTVSTYNSLDKAEVFGHHVFKVISDENSSDVHLKNIRHNEYFNWMSFATSETL